MPTLLRDVRLALRLLAKDRAYSGTVLATLALCIGANVAIFGVIHSVLFEPLPYPGAERLVNVFNSYPGAGVPRASIGSVDYFVMRDEVPAFSDLALYQGGGATVGEPGSAARVLLARVTPSFFSTLRVELELGRGFTEDEMDDGNHRKAVLTHPFWVERFAASRDVVGRDLRVDGEAFEVVGVLPEDFVLVNGEDRRLLTPLRFTARDRSLEQWHSNNYTMVARLAPGATIEVASAQIRAMHRGMIEASSLPNVVQLLADARFSTVVVDAAADTVRDVRGTLFMLWAGVGFILLIGCVNIANLTLARAQARRADLATRLALGARRSRVARHVLTESLVVALAGGAIGLAVGAAGLASFDALGAGGLPRASEIAVSPAVVLYTLAIALATGVVFGLIPVGQLARNDLSGVFRASGRTGTATRRSALFQNALVTAQVSLAFVTLIGAGLMLLSFRAALAVDPGFEPEGVLASYVALPAARYPDGGARVAFVDELVQRVGALPGVAAASITNQLPFGGGNSNTVITPEGYVPPPGESVLSPRLSTVGPGYFATMGIEVLEGRAFEASDNRDQPRYIVIDEWLARRYWPGESPLGRRMVFGQPPGADSVPEQSIATILGVVESIHHDDLTAAPDEHVGAYYFTYKQGSVSVMTLVTRASAEPAALTPAIRGIVTDIDPDLPLFGVQTMQSLVSESLAPRRVPMTLLLVFGSVALFLAMVGIYGALSYSVARRTREMGIRVAVGSTPREVFGMIVRQGASVTGLGVVLGAAAAIVLARLLESLLFGVRATDPTLMVGVALILGATGVGACVVPALRATRVDPVSALSEG